MRPKRAVVVGLFLLSWSIGAEASGPFAFRGSVELGKPPRTTTVTVAQTDDGAELTIEGVRVRLPIAQPQRADLQAVGLASGASVGLLQVSAAEGRRAGALLVRNAAGKPEVLWSGSLDLKGDPGERRGTQIDVFDYDEDGKPDVILSDYEERVRLCGQQRTALRPRAVDPLTLRLRPIALNRVASQPAPIAELKLVAESPGPTAAPLLRALRLVGVSSQTGAAAEPWLASPPVALVDGRPETYWSEEQGQGGRGEFATFSWDGSGFGLRALAIVPLPAGLPGGTPASIPRTLWLIGDGGARIELQLPEAPEPGRRYWAAFAEPLRWNCLSVVVQDSAPLRAGKPGPAVIADIEGYSDLDFGPGVEPLLQQLAAGGAQAGHAAHLLAALGPTVVVPKLTSLWPTLSATGRRRAVRVLASSASVDPGARALLATALRDDDPDVRTAAFDALLEAGAEGRAALRPRIAEAGAAGDAAALALVRAAPGETLPAVLEALSRPGGSERAALREAIAIAARTAGEPALALLRTWVGSAGVAGRAALVLALTAAQHAEGATPLALEVLRTTAPKADAFEDRWRLVSAARLLPSDPEVDTWLATLAKLEERWMLRAAAIEGLAEHEAAQTEAIATSALKDAYPRVRMAAATALGPHRNAQLPLATSALRDKWPMVRVAALDAIAAQPGAEPVLRKAVGDGSRKGRAAAIRGLTLARVSGAWPLVKQRLEDKEEWPEVLSEGVRFARELCVHQAGDTLLALLRRGAKPDAWEPDADLGLQALGALLQLGGEAAKSATQLANRAGVPPAFKATYEADHARPGPRCPAR